MRVFTQGKPSFLELLVCAEGFARTRVRAEGSPPGACTAEVDLISAAGLFVRIVPPRSESYSLGLQRIENGEPRFIPGAGRNLSGYFVFGELEPGTSESPPSPSTKAEELEP